LKIYPKIIIKNPTNQKNVSNNFVFITFLSMRNSGRLSPTTAIIKARAVHIGIQVIINDLTMGMTQAAFAYIGIHMSTASGTAKAF